MSERPPAPNDAWPSFDRLLEPIDTHTFATEYFGRALLHVSGRAADRYRNLLGTDELERLLVDNQDTEDKEDLMSKQDAKAFFEHLEQNEALREQLVALGPNGTVSDMLNAAKSAGFSCTPDELEAAGEERYQDRPLTEAELEAVAGGVNALQTLGPGSLLASNRSTSAGLMAPGASASPFVR
jgi:predicted ribosomally synthesized peptide with nif11-like leader